MNMKGYSGPSGVLEFNIDLRPSHRLNPPHTLQFMRVWGTITVINLISQILVPRKQYLKSHKLKHRKTYKGTLSYRKKTLSKSTLFKIQSLSKTTLRYKYKVTECFLDNFLLRPEATGLTEGSAICRDTAPCWRLNVVEGPLYYVAQFKPVPAVLCSIPYHNHLSLWSWTQVSYGIWSVDSLRFKTKE